MRKVGLYIFIIWIFFLFTSCKCPTDIDTPRIIEPDNSAFLRLVNCHTGENISLNSDDISVITSLMPASVSEKMAVVSDNSIISILGKDKNVLLNMPVNLEKDSSYIAVFMSSGSFSTLKIFDEGTVSAVERKIRFVNATTDIYKIYIDDVEVEQEVAFAETTRFINLKSKKTSVKILKNHNLVWETELDINAFVNTYIINKLSGKIDFINLTN